MAVTLANQNTWYDVAVAGPYTSTIDGYTINWNNVIQARWTGVSGSTYAMQYRCVVRKNSGNSTNNQSSYNGYSIGGSGATTSSASNINIQYPNIGDNAIKTVSGTFSGASGTVTGGVKLGYYGTTWGGTNLTGSFNLPSAGTPPVGLAASDVTPMVDGFLATVSLTSWGTGGSTADRRKSMSVRTYDESSLIEPRRYTTIYENTLSSDITVNNQSTASGGDLIIVGNTRYTLSIYANNGIANTGHIRVGDYVTLAYPVSLSSPSFESGAATFEYDVPADGGFYDKTIEYSIDGGDNWTTVATHSGGAAASGSFTVSGLSEGVEYEILVRTSTTAGSSTTSRTFSLDTTAFYGSHNSQAERVSRLYGALRTLVDMAITVPSSTSNVKTVNKNTFMSRLSQNVIHSNKNISKIYVEITRPGANYRLLLRLRMNDNSYMTLDSVEGQAANVVSVLGSWGITTKYSATLIANTDILSVAPSYTSEAKLITKLYGSDNGQTKLVFSS